MRITKIYQIDVRRGRSDIENGKEGISAVHLDVAEDVQPRDEWGRRVLGGDLFTIELEKNKTFLIWEF
jgi:hypothetical protein